MFIDDGWQRLSHGRGYQGCGDWLPDAAKFDDLAQTMKTIHSSGAAVALWVAPLLLGQQSVIFPSLYEFAPTGNPSSAARCWTRATRRSETTWLILRLVRDFDVDLLKIDFLDRAMAYWDRPCGGDIADVGQAVAEMLAAVRSRLTDAGRGDVAFEFRQPYVSPAIARFGDILRANDCPADSVVNRSTSLDARLISVGQMIHADPMMWGPAGGAEAVAQQLYSGWFAVPQISMRLSELSPVQTVTLRGLLALWRDQAEVSTDPPHQRGRTWLRPGARHPS